MTKLIDLYNKTLDFIFEHKGKIVAGIIVLAIIWSVTSCVEGTATLPEFND